MSAHFELVPGMREETRTHRTLARLAERQHGVISTGQLIYLGYSSSAIGRAAANGRLHRVHRGVYAVGHLRLSPYGRCMAAVLGQGADALLSHSSAAWLWGIFRRCDRPIEVTVKGRRRSRGPLRIHHATSLVDTDRASRRGIPTTAVPRTLLDLAGTLSPQRLMWALERSERFDLLDVIEIQQLLARAGHHRGGGALRRALDSFLEPAFTRSGLERHFLRLVRESNLPMPSTNIFVAGFELDMYWQRERFAVELDGYEHHRTRAAFERDRLRQEELKLAGIEMIRLTSKRLAREPEIVVERLAALLKRRRRELR